MCFSNKDGYIYFLLSDTNGGCAKRLQRDCTHLIASHKSQVATNTSDQCFQSPCNSFHSLIICQNKTQKSGKCYTQEQTNGSKVLGAVSGTRSSMPFFGHAALPVHQPRSSPNLFVQECFITQSLAPLASPEVSGVRLSFPQSNQVSGLSGNQLPTEATQGSPFS